MFRVKVQIVLFTIITCLLYTEDICSQLNKNIANPSKTIFQTFLILQHNHSSFKMVI